MPKKRVHEIAKEQGLTSKDVLAALKDAGVYVKAASSTVEERDVKRAFPGGPPAKAAEPAPAKAEPVPAKAEPEPAKDAEEAPQGAVIADRDADGKAKVPRARATKRGGAAPKAEPAAEPTAKARAKA